MAAKRIYHTLPRPLHEFSCRYQKNYDKFVGILKLCSVRPADLPNTHRARTLIHRARRLSQSVSMNEWQTMRVAP